MSSPSMEDREAEERAKAVPGAPCPVPDTDSGSASTKNRAQRTENLAPRTGHRAPSHVRLALLIGLIAFGVYLRTLAISIIWGDSPELTAAAYNLGIPHPTGYPLY